MESFTVGSTPPKTFQYSQNEVGNPFPLLSENGGVLKPGKPVRVTLAGNAIIKVETDKRLPNLSALLTFWLGKVQYRERTQVAFA